MIQMVGSRRAVPEESGERSFRSPGLELVLARLDALSRPMVLDLGAPRRANVELLAGSGCKVWIEDLPHFLVGHAPAAPEREGDEPDWDGLVGASLAFDRHERFDVVLAWDLLAFLEPAAARPLMRRVAAACKGGALLFVTVSTVGGLAERPAHISASRDGRLTYKPSGPSVRDNPAPTPVALERMMPGFRLLHSFLLGEGMQDYLFSHQGP